MAKYNYESVEWVKGNDGKSYKMLSAWQRKEKDPEFMLARSGIFQLDPSKLDPNKKYQISIQKAKKKDDAKPNSPTINIVLQEITEAEDDNTTEVNFAEEATNAFNF